MNADKSGTRTNGANSGSRASNWNNYPWNSNWNIGLRAACDDELIYPCRMVTATDTDQQYLWSVAPPCYGEYITRSRERRVGGIESRTCNMGKRHKNLIDEICSMPNLYRAYEKAAHGKRYSAGHLQFKQHLAANLAMLSAALRDGSYRPSKPNTFFVNEPKRREISALPFSDRVVQHALCNVIEPIFERTFLPGSYACRRNKGTHVAVVDAQAVMRRGYTWCLKMDFSKYFASIDRSILNREIQRKISCPATLALIGVFLKPDGVGLPIGNLTSQLFANIYGHIQDRYLTHTLGLKNWLRYMDDTIIFAHSREALAVIQQGLKWFVEQRMRLRFSHWSIIPVANGVSFLGYRIWPKYKLLLRASVVRAKRKINRYTRLGLSEHLERYWLMARACQMGEFSQPFNQTRSASMIGKPKVISTRADLDLAKTDSPDVYAAFVAALKGSMVSTADTQVYPANYDHTLKEGDAGYIAPKITPIEDMTTIASFGFTRDEVLSL